MMTMKRRERAPSGPRGGWGAEPASPMGCGLCNRSAIWHPGFPVKAQKLIPCVQTSPGGPVTASRQNAGHWLNLSFRQTTSNFSVVCLVSSALHATYTKKFFIAYLKFRFHWVSCISICYAGKLSQNVLKKGVLSKAKGPRLCFLESLSWH